MVRVCFISQETQKVNIVEDKEHKKKELQEKVHVLSEKKHLLVQMLKQVMFCNSFKCDFYVYDIFICCNLLL